jgi:hypothetical protein
MALSAVLPLALLCAALTPQNAQGQVWRQTAQVAVPIQQDTPVRALVDTLTSVMQRRDSVIVRREEGGRPIQFSELQSTLIDEQGLDLQSANVVYFDYVFEQTGDGFTERITRMKFIRRPGGLQGGSAQQDIPLMYLNSERDPIVREVMQKKGTTLQTNQAAIRLFIEQLAFAKVMRGSAAGEGRRNQPTITRIGQRTVREGFEREKERLVNKIIQLTY